MFSRVKFTVEEEEDEGQESGLLVELEGKDEKKERETNLWFSKVCHIVFRLLFQKLVIQRLAACLFTHNISHEPTPTHEVISERPLNFALPSLCRAFSLRSTWKETLRVNSNRPSGFTTNKPVALCPFFLFQLLTCVKKRTESL